MKSTQNLDYRILADHLIDRGLIDREAAEHVLRQCAETGAVLSEVLVNDGLVSDWEVSRVCCEFFHLPFLPVDVYSPAAGATDGLDPDYLRRYDLVPLDRFGEVLTVVMPGIVSSAVLEGLRRRESLRILPVVGSVLSNRRWLQENLPEPEEEALELEEVAAALPISEDDGAWAGIFDAGDEAVQLELQERDEDS